MKTSIQFSAFVWACMVLGQGVWAQVPSIPTLQARTRAQAVRTGELRAGPKTRRVNRAVF
jgi:hypothetical protein